jgi:hypothetical protein
VVCGGDELDKVMATMGVLRHHFGQFPKHGASINATKSML